MLIVETIARIPREHFINGKWNFLQILTHRSVTVRNGSKSGVLLVR
jgi:hypothetical protein